MAAIDETDRAILYILQTEAREITNTEIGERIGVSSTTVGDRISKLREQRVIKGAQTAIDYERAGLPHRLLLNCSVSATDRDTMAQQAIDVGGVVAVRELLSGSHNLEVEMVGATTTQLSETIESLESLGVDVGDGRVVASEYRRPFDGFGESTVTD